MAGLAAAWFLGARHHVTLFERQPRLGIGAHSLEAPGGVVDVPLRVIYPGYYPELFTLLGQTGVPVLIQGVWVRTGDWLYADEDGIVVMAGKA